jgi:hypothetical protein
MSYVIPTLSVPISGFTNILLFSIYVQQNESDIKQQGDDRQYDDGTAYPGRPALFVILLPVRIQTRTYECAVASVTCGGVVKL